MQITTSLNNNKQLVHPYASLPDSQLVMQLRLLCT